MLLFKFEKLALTFHHLSIYVALRCESNSLKYILSSLSLKSVTKTPYTYVTANVNNQL